MMSKVQRAVFYMASVLVILITSFVVNAVESITVTMNEKVNADKTVVVNVSFTEDVAAAGTIKIKYNNEKLELISAEEGSMESQMLLINPLEDEIFISFLNAYGNIKDNTEAAVIKFDLSGDNLYENDIVVSEFELYDIDSNLISDQNMTEAVYNIIDDSTSSIISKYDEPLSDNVSSDSIQSYEESELNNNFENHSISIETENEELSKNNEITNSVHSDNSISYNSEHSRLEISDDMSSSLESEREISEILIDSNTVLDMSDNSLSPSNSSSVQKGEINHIKRKISEDKYDVDVSWEYYESILFCKRKYGFLSAYVYLYEF